MTMIPIRPRRSYSQTPSSVVTVGVGVEQNSVVHSEDYGFMRAKTSHLISESCQINIGTTQNSPLLKRKLTKGNPF